MKIRLGEKQQYLLDNFLNLFVLSAITGLFAGLVVTFYNICTSYGEEYSQKLYTLLVGNPAFIPLLILGLAAGGVLIGTLVRFVPMIRGSGIPQIEGAARGTVPFKWYITMCSMFAASLACVFMGLAAGAEGPSLEIGGCAGSAVATTLKRHQMTKRLQIAGGASAGFAVAFNAPVTGLIFAMEEAFRSFSPQVFVCSAISVIVALFTRNAIRPALGLSTGFAFEHFKFISIEPLQSLWVALASVAVSLLAVAFYHLVFLAKKLFKRITFFKGAGKYIIPFTLAGAFGLITVYAMGGGHTFIDSLSSGSSQTVSVFGAPLIVSLIVVVVFRFISAIMAMGCGIPCGVFIPMLAIGVGAGAIFSELFQLWGMNPLYSDYFIIICMSSFFTCVVQAPITALFMIFELTGQFVNIFPALMGVSIGYLMGLVFRLEPIYEKSLDLYIQEENLYEKTKQEILHLTVQPRSRADGGKVRSIIWPANGLVVECKTANGEIIVPDGETILHAYDQIIFSCVTDDIGELYDYMYTIVGKPPEN